MTETELHLHYMKKVEITVINLPVAIAVSFMFTDKEAKTIEITAFFDKEE